MEWDTQGHTYEEINRAGRVLIERNSAPSDVYLAIEIINNWRAAHAFPLNTMQVRLRDKAAQISRPKVSIAQRIKRMEGSKTNDEVYHKWKCRCAIWRLQIQARKFHADIQRSLYTVRQVNATFEQLRVAMGALPVKKSLWQQFIGRMSLFTRGTSL